MEIDDKFDELLYGVLGWVLCLGTIAMVVAGFVATVRENYLGVQGRHPSWGIVTAKESVAKHIAMIGRYPVVRPDTWWVTVKQVDSSGKKADYRIEVEKEIYERITLGSDWAEYQKK